MHAIMKLMAATANLRCYNIPIKDDRNNPGRILFRYWEKVSNSWNTVIFIELGAPSHWNLSQMCIRQHDSPP